MPFRTTRLRETLLTSALLCWVALGCGNESASGDAANSTTLDPTTPVPASGETSTPTSTATMTNGMPSMSTPTATAPLTPPTPTATTTGPSPDGQGGSPSATGGSGGTASEPVVPEPQATPEPQVTPDPRPEPEPAAQPEPATEPDAQPEPTAEPQPEPEPATTDCTTPPPPSALVGWASEEGGTTGGGDATPMVVSSAQDFASAISGNDARVVHVEGTLDGSFVFGSNKTVIGICGAELHGDLHFAGVSNVILRNIKVVGRNCSDSPSDCSGGEDAIAVNGGAHHLWFDHLDVSDGSDGNLDITQASDFVTVSYTKFSYSTRRTDPDAGESGHRFSNLIGSSDSDAGEYRITWHHNWWADNIDQRMPRSRFGRIHVYNNLFTASGNSYCTNAGIDSELLVQNNVYRGVNNPLSPDANGAMRAEGNLFDNVTGNQEDNGGNVFTPPYTFALDETGNLADTLMAQVGPQ